MNLPRIDLSIIVPAYNEAERILPTLTRIVEYSKAQNYVTEIIVVDDGSRDKTRQVVNDFAAKNPIVRLEKYDDAHGEPMNKGKGFAVRTGILQSRGAVVLFSDADLSTPIEEIEKLWLLLREQKCEIAIASRALPQSNLTVHQPWYREAMGRTFNLFVQRLLVPGIRDTQCGFKLFEGNCARRIFSACVIDGFGFDTEVLFLARKWQYRVLEVAVTWRHQEESRVNPLVAPLQMLREIVRVRKNDAARKYDSFRAQDVSHAENSSHDASDVSSESSRSQSDLHSTSRVTRGSGHLELFLARRRIEKVNRLIASKARRGCLLDVGCGTTPHFLKATRFREKWGLDRVAIPFQGVNKAGDTLTILRQDVASSHLPFSDGFFDVVTMLAVFEHIEKDELPHLLREVHRVLKPDGCYILTTPAGWTGGLLLLMARLNLVSSEEIDEHQDAYSLSQIKTLLQESGFESDGIEGGCFELGANLWTKASKK